MAGLGRVLVGYRQNDRRRLRIVDEYGIQHVPVRKCAAGCGFDVFVNPSGMAAMHDKDPEVVCTECADLYRIEFEESAL